MKLDKRYHDSEEDCAILQRNYQHMTGVVERLQDVLKKEGEKYVSLEKASQIEIAQVRESYRVAATEKEKLLETNATLQKMYDVILEKEEREKQIKRNPPPNRSEVQQENVDSQDEMEDREDGNEEDLIDFVDRLRTNRERGFSRHNGPAAAPVSNVTE